MTNPHASQKATQASSAGAPIRVLCIDDHAVVAKGLGAGMQTERDIQVVGWRGNADDIVRAADETGATIALVDVDMPGQSAFDAIEELHRDRPNCRAIVLSAFTRDHYIDLAVAAGAWGYLSKNDDFETIISAVRTVARGGFAFGPAALERCEMVRGRLRPKSIARPGARAESGANAEAPRAPGGGGTQDPSGTTPAAPVSRLSTLTAQELQVLRLIARGLSTREVAAEIHRSEKRVEAVRTSILKKLCLDDRVELTRFAIREGLVEA